MCFITSTALPCWSMAFFAAPHHSNIAHSLHVLTYTFALREPPPPAHSCWFSVMWTARWELVHSLKQLCGVSVVPARVVGTPHPAKLFSWTFAQSCTSPIKVYTHLFLDVLWPLHCLQALSYLIPTEVISTFVRLCTSPIKVVMWACTPPRTFLLGVGCSQCIPISGPLVTRSTPVVLHVGFERHHACYGL